MCSKNVDYWCSIKIIFNRNNFTLLKIYSKKVFCLYAKSTQRNCLHIYLFTSALIVLSHNDQVVAALIVKMILPLNSEKQYKSRPMAHLSAKFRGDPTKPVEKLMFRTTEFY